MTRRKEDKAGVPASRIVDVLRGQGFRCTSDQGKWPVTLVFNAKTGLRGTTVTVPGGYLDEKALRTLQRQTRLSRDLFQPRSR